MLDECAFREDHQAKVTMVPIEKFGVAALQFECECGEYIVSTDLLELYSKRWKQDGTGKKLGIVAKRRIAQGHFLELITDEDVKDALLEQGRFEQRYPKGE
jgi:hypothetical protein